MFNLTIRTITIIIVVCYYETFWFLHVLFHSQTRLLYYVLSVDVKRKYYSVYKRNNCYYICVSIITLQLFKNNNSALHSVIPRNMVYYRTHGPLDNHKCHVAQRVYYCTVVNNNHNKLNYHPSAVNKIIITTL